MGHGCGRGGSRPCPRSVNMEAFLSKQGGRRRWRVEGYVCMYVCMYVYLYICIYIYICIHTYLCIYIYIYAYVCICAYILPEPSILNILGHGREPPRPQPCPIYLPLRPMTLAVTVFPQAVYAQHTFCLLFVCVSSYMSNTKAQEKVSIEVVHPCLVCFDLGVHSYMPWCSTHVHVCSMSFLKNQ